MSLATPSAYFVYLFLSLIVFISTLLFETAIVNFSVARLKAAERKKTFGASRSRKIYERGNLGISELQILLLISGALASFFIFCILNNLYPDLSPVLVLSASLLVLAFLYQVVSSLGLSIVENHLADRLLLLFAWPLSVACLLLRPIVWFGSMPARLLNRHSGNSNSSTKKTSAELALLVTGSEEEVHLDREEEEMIQGVCEFSEMIAREVMTPRPDFVVIPVGASFSEVVKIIMESGFSRFPVIEDRVDNVIGILLARDLMEYVAKFIDTGENGFSVTSVMREAFFIPNTKPIDDLLGEFKARKHHLAIVLDEHGGVDGLVTLEDLIEEIVGEIYDESDQHETDISLNGQGDVILDGGVLVDEVNEKFSLSIPVGDYDTVAGYILAQLGRMPQEGDTITIGELEADEGEETVASEDLIQFVVERIEGHRIEEIKLLGVASDEEADLEVNQ